MPDSIWINFEIYDTENPATGSDGIIFCLLSYSIRINFDFEMVVNSKIDVPGTVWYPVFILSVQFQHFLNYCAVIAQAWNLVLSAKFAFVLEPVVEQSVSCNNNFQLL